MSCSTSVYLGWFMNGYMSLFDCLVECSLDMNVYKLVYLTIVYLPRLIEGVDESQHTNPSTSPTPANDWLKALMNSSVSHDASGRSESADEPNQKYVDVLRGIALR